MREVVFLQQNKKKWEKFEAILSDRRSANPDTLADLYIQLTDDLSYANTFYPGRKTAQYLNALTVRVHQAIYRNKVEDRKRILTFWKYELPLLFRHYHRHLLYSFIIFTLSMSVGWISAANDNSFVRLILGDAYVNMTLKNIESGDPMAVYKNFSQTTGFLMITFNNIWVSFYAFVGGFLWSLGTVYILFQNGVMLGSFHYLFYDHHILGTSLLVVYIHGALEISAIIIAGCAGLVVGSSVLFPGTYSRGHALKRGAIDGLKIAFGLIPIFITAGFLESFVTRYTEMPIYLSLLIIGGSLAFIIWYFIFYPIQLNRERDRGRTFKT